MSPRTLDHIALWVTGRDEIADFACARLGMRVIDRTDAFTLVGADARRGKLTLFEAEGPRERGVLKHVALRAADAEEAEHELPDGLVVRVVRAETDVDYDLDHIALHSFDPAATADAWTKLGFRRAGDTRVEIGGAYVDFHRGDARAVERPLLNHVGVLVDSAEEQRAAAEARGLEVADFVDAPNTRSVFVWGPERVKVEYVEHKSTFSLV